MKYLTLIVVLGLAQACGSATDQDAVPPTVEKPNQTTTSFPKPLDRITTTSLPPITGEVPAEMLDPVLRDAAALSGVGMNDLEVIRSQAMEWPDGSLGCPRPGEEYIQVIVPGYWVEIDGPDRRYDYRLDQQGNFRLCEPRFPLGSTPTPPTTTGGDSSD